MIQNELVSIICPTYNAGKYISATIESVLNQDYRNFELLIVDDHSADNTIASISPYLSDPRVHLVAQEFNQGPASARNRAIQLAQGRFIAFLDSDDLWASNKLSTQIMFMTAHNHSFTYSEFNLIDDDGALIGPCQKLERSISYRELLKHCIIQNSTVVYDVVAHGKVYCPQIRRRQDFGLFLNLLRNGAYATLVVSDLNDAPKLASYRLRRGSVSSSKLRNIPMQWAIYRKFEQLSLPQSTYFIAHWLVKSGYKNFVRLARRLNLMQQQCR